MSAAALASALAKGAVEYVTGLIGRATPAFGIITSIRKAFSGLSAQEAATVFWTGQLAWNAGVDQTSLPANVPLALADIPINPDLFGASPSGFRMRYSVLGEYQLPGENRSRFVHFNVNSDVPQTSESLAGIWQSRFDALTYDTARRLGADNTGGAIVLGIKIESVERQF